MVKCIIGKTLANNMWQNFSIDAKMDTMLDLMGQIVYLNKLQSTTAQHQNTLTYSIIITRLRQQCSLQLLDNHFLQQFCSNIILVMIRYLC